MRKDVWVVRRFLEMARKVAIKNSPIIMKGYRKGQAEACPLILCI